LLLFVRSFPRSTTAMLCSTALHSALFTSSSECRTTPQESLIKREDDLTHAADGTALQWPVEQRIYKLAMLTFKIWQVSAPAYLSHHITARSGTRSLQSSSDELTLTNNIFAALHLQLRTLSLLLSSTVTLSLSLYLSPG